MDIVKSEVRSKIMAAVGRTNTRPELAVRKMIHAMGYRFRLHDRQLPGTPDLVFSSRRCVIFVHGCFWHRHVGCERSTIPRSQRAFWVAKFRRNRCRDQRALRALNLAGWKAMAVWECELTEPDRLSRQIKTFLQPNGLTRRRSA